MYPFLRLIVGLYFTYCSYKYTKIGLNAFLDGILDSGKENSLPPSDSEFSDSDSESDFSDSDSKLLDTDLKNLDPTHIPPGGVDRALELAKKAKPGPITKMIEKSASFLGKLIGGLLLKNPKLFALVEKLDTIFRHIIVICQIMSVLLTFRFFGLLELEFWLDLIRRGVPNRFYFKHFLNALRRMMLGYKNGNCQNDTTSLIDDFADPNILEEHKYLKLKQIFKYYENIGERNFLKNPYFFCIMQIFLTLFLLNERGPFLLIIKHLTKLFANKIISKETYNEFVSYLINQGANPLDFPDVDFD